MSAVTCPHFCDYDCCLNRGGGSRAVAPPVVTVSESYAKILRERDRERKRLSARGVLAAAAGRPIG